MTFSAMLHAGSRPRRECAWERFRHCPGSRSEATGFYQNERTLDYKIQPGDNLFIRATSIIDEKNSVILNGDARGNYLTSDASIYLNSYTVNKDGYIDYPLTGLVEVKNLTVEEAKDRLQNELAKYVKETALMVLITVQRGGGHA